MVRLALLLVVLSGSSFAQDIKSNFVLDQSKPYVYLKFDHIGPRKPYEAREGNTGLWLRVVNNCRISILFRGSDAPEGGPGVVIDDEVIPDEPMMQIFSTPEEGAEIERKAREREQQLKHKPQGYESEVSGVVRLQPGEEILFSVPLNHVGEYWFMRVKFALDLNNSSIAVGPFTYLDFYKYDIPKK
jgi:hypothetical protein